MILEFSALGVGLTLHVLHLLTPGTAEVALWLGLTRYSADYFQWQSTGELVSPYDLGLNFEYPLTVDDAVVMNRAWSWAWQIVSKSSLAQAVCQRGQHDKHAVICCTFYDLICGTLFDLIYSTHFDLICSILFDFLLYLL